MLIGHKDRTGLGPQGTLRLAIPRKAARARGSPRARYTLLASRKLAPIFFFSISLDFSRFLSISLEISRYLSISRFLSISFDLLLISFEIPGDLGLGGSQMLEICSVPVVTGSEATRNLCNLD